MHAAGSSEAFAPSSATADQLVTLPLRADDQVRDLCKLIGLPPARSVLVAGSAGPPVVSAWQRLGYRVVSAGAEEERICDLVFDVPSDLAALETEGQRLAALKARRARLAAAGWLVMTLGGEARACKAAATRSRPSCSGRTAAGQSEARAADGHRGAAGGAAPDLMMQIITLLHAAGFCHVQVFGSLSGSPKKLEDPMVLVAQCR